MAGAAPRRHNPRLSQGREPAAHGVAVDGEARRKLRLRRQPVAGTVVPFGDLAAQRVGDGLPDRGAGGGCHGSFTLRGVVREGRQA